MENQEVSRELEIKVASCFILFVLVRWAARLNNSIAGPFLL